MWVLVGTNGFAIEDVNGPLIFHTPGLAQTYRSELLRFRGIISTIYRYSAEYIRPEGK